MPISCTDAILPVVNYDYCNPEIVFGEVSRILFTRPGDGLTSVTSLSEWTGRISNSLTPPSTGLWPIRDLLVSAELPEPEIGETEISGGRKVYSTPKYKVPFESTDFNLQNIAFVRAIQDAGGAQFAMWFESQKFIWGGNSGVVASIKISAIIPKERTNLCSIKGEFSFEGVLPANAATPFV